MLNKIIGNTPMIKINYRYKGKAGRVFAKLEYFNASGSIKDRVAFYIIKNALKRGELKEGMPIVEATSGNTGISLSSIGRYYNCPVYIFMPDWASKERISIMQSYGANVLLVSKEDGGFMKCISEAQKKAKEINGFWANQFENDDNCLAHYETTGVEIVNQLPENVGGFVSGIGTGGTLMGIGKRLKEKYESTLIVAIEPSKMPLLSGGVVQGQHKIEGIGDDFIPKLVDSSKIDRVIQIDDEDSINMSRCITRKLGIGIGISSGANFLGSVLLGSDIETSVVTVFADDNKKYLSTDLVKDIDENPKFMSNQIELINYEMI